MKIGFTGTQKGMTVMQKEVLVMELAEQLKKKIGSNIPFEFHHGDCIGADKEAHDIIVVGGGGLFRIIIHPPEMGTKRAWCGNCGGVEIRPNKPYLERDQDIVDETDMLIAVPKENQEQVRSGTWATVRYARKQGKKVVIILPTGEIQ